MCGKDRSRQGDGEFNNQREHGRQEHCKWSSTANTQIPGGLEGCREQRLPGPVQEDLVCESYQRQAPF